MATPTDFTGSNITMLAPKGQEDQVRDVRAFQNGACCVTCWELTEAELEAIAKDGKVYLSVFGLISDGVAGMPPVFVATESVMRDHVAQFGDTFVAQAPNESDIIFALIHNMAPPDMVVTADMTLEQIGVDSLDIFQLMVDVEDKFEKISVEDGEWTINMTVQQLVDSIIQKISQAN